MPRPPRRLRRQCSAPPAGRRTAWALLAGAGCAASPDWTPGASPGSDTAADTATPDADRCALEARWPEGRPDFLEGDTVTAELSCGGERRGWSLQLVDGPEGAALDGWTLTWATGLADGGRWDLLFSAKRDDSDALPSSATLTVWVADAGDDPDNVPVDPAAYTEEWGLPVLHVAPADELGGEYVPATFTFEGRAYDAEIKIRGAASYDYPKHGFTLRFPGEEPDFSGQGLQKRDHLVLISTFDDNSYVRQKLTYDLWRAMAEHQGVRRLTPRTFFAVVYLDTVYYGLFVACDRIDDEFLDHMGLDRDANLYKAVDHDANFYLTDSGGNPKDTLHDGYEKKEGEPASGEGAFDDLDALVSFTGGSSTEAFLADMDEWIVPEEFMDWFILVHYAAADDSGGKNSYLAHDASTGGQPFRYAPWDFNHSWGQDWRTWRESADTLNDFTWTNAVFAHFLADPDTAAALRDRLVALRHGGPLELSWLLDTVEGYYDLIEPSAERDWALWGPYYRTYDAWADARNAQDDWTDFDGERAYLEQWLVDRDAVMAATWEGE